ncbi:MAG TPA: Dna2/Cas4 domain-containing protein [Anaerolineaceae bacterium]|nr:Dna2/Cas4 domain-containing protein [Anaerolineaceae bacterium]
MIYLGLFLILLALLLLLLSKRQQREAGLPAGRVIYSDTRAWGKIEKPFYDAMLGLTGKPDYLVEQDGVSIPIEVKSGWAPPEPYAGHIYQVAAYCLLVKQASGKRPPYGLLHYRNRTFAIDFTPELESSLMELLLEMRQHDKQGEADRSHEEPLRCERCGYRSNCDQRL